MKAERAATVRMEQELQIQLKLQLEHRSEQLKQLIQKEFPVLPAARKTFPELVEAMYNVCSSHKGKHLSHFQNFLRTVLQNPNLQHAFQCMVYAGAYGKDLSTSFLSDSAADFASGPTIHPPTHQSESNACI